MDLGFGGMNGRKIKLNKKKERKVLAKKLKLENILPQYGR
jgi:hypothetical protein